MEGNPNEPPERDNVPVVAAIPVAPENMAEILSTNSERANQIHTELRDAIAGLGSVAACAAFFSDNAQFVQVRRVLRSRQSLFVETTPIRPIVRALEEWARLWAEELRMNTDNAWALNNCRKTALLLLYRVCDLAPPGGNDEEERAQMQQIEQVFERRRIDDILHVCLVLDRANCLYSMRSTTSFELGLGWYASGEEPLYQNLNNPALPINRSGHTINKRLKRLQRGLYADDEILDRWLTVAAPGRLMPRPNHV